MSTGDHHEDSAEEMTAELPPLKWSRATFDDLIRNFKFPESWGARFPDEGQTAADAPTGYITLFWDFFFVSNFRLPVTNFFLDILDYYKFHISQMHPIGIVRVRHFEFVCRTMHIEPTVPRFRVFHQMHCSQGFYSFMQRASAKKILLQPPKSFHDWKQKFFFIKVGVILMRMTFRGKEAVLTETIQTPSDENWYQDLKDVMSIALSEKALVGASMSLNWRMNWEEKPVYMEGDKTKIWGLTFVSLYVVAFEREGGKMATIPRNLMRSFGELSNLGTGPEKKRRAPAATAAPKKSDVDKTQSSRAKNLGGEKKGMCHSSDSWCDNVVVSDSLEGLAPAVVRKPKPEPRDTADIPPSNLDDPIDLESNPERLLRKKAGKRKQTDVEAEGLTRRSRGRKSPGEAILMPLLRTRFLVKKTNSPVQIEPSSMVDEKLPPSPPRAPVNEPLGSAEVPENDAEKVAGAENPEVEKSADAVFDAEKITSPEVVDVGASRPQTPELAAQDTDNVEKVSAEDQGSFFDADKNFPIRPDETLGDYYYRTYSEKDASEIYSPVWNLKKGDAFSDWRVCRDWLKGTFPPGEIKFQEGRLHDQTYHAYLEGAASYTSTTHRIVREWHSMHKEWAAFKASKKKAAEVEARAAQLRAKLEADQAKFENDRKTKEWSVAGWKRKAEAEAALLSE
ncbi:hypothetical protein HanPSC8_Chr05g0195011 [Helianthus annuus]|nr:hypothetical protein HanIR_Chr05g0218231 [Helianthus annuus]KAJ0921731.1 hypothetical protein HanPSC8_Chr05g0195011 [Helianthus annuus]